MAGMANFLETELFDHVLRGLTWASPATVYMALYTDDPTDADAGTDASGDGYARIAAPSWSAAVDGATANAGLLQFPAADGGNWGPITHAGIRDDITGGNLIAFCALGAPLTVVDGQVGQIPAGNLDGLAT